MNKTNSTINELLSNFLKTQNKDYLKFAKLEINKLLIPYKTFGCKIDYDSSYYVKSNGKEVIDIIKDITGDNYIYYMVGNIIKYIERYKDKYEDIQGQCNDLVKALKYLEMLEG